MKAESEPAPVLPAGPASGWKRTDRWLKLVLVAVPLVGLQLIWGIFGTTTLAKLEFPDGTQYKVGRSFNWNWWEPWIVTFYTRDRSSGAWTGHYVDHEAWFWRGLETAYDPVNDRMVLREQGVPRVIVDHRRKTWWFDNGQFTRETPL